jgi:hypothetical protein
MHFLSYPLAAANQPVEHLVFPLVVKDKLLDEFTATAGEDVSPACTAKPVWFARIRYGM